MEILIGLVLTVVVSVAVGAWVWEKLYNLIS